MQRMMIVSLLIFFIPGLIAQTRITRHSPEQISLTFTLPEVSVDPVTVNDETYSLVTYREGRYADGPGAPMTPYTIVRIAVPEGAAVTARSQAGPRREVNNVDLFPANPAAPFGREYRLRIDNDIYRSAAPYPAQIATVGEPYRFRRHWVVDVRINPVQYFPAERRLALLSTITVQLTLKNGRPGGQAAVRYSDSEENLLRRRILNFEQARGWSVGRPRQFARRFADYDFSSGNWYKIPVTAEGVYRITGRFLRDQGINIDQIDPSTFQLFSYGGDRLPVKTGDPRPDDLNEVALEITDGGTSGVFEDNDVIYFYGRDVEGWRYDDDAGKWEHYSNPFSFTNYYLFTYGQRNGKRIPQVNTGTLPGAARAGSFEDLYNFSEDNTNILQSGLDWYWIKYQGIAAESVTNFTLPSNIISGESSFVIRLKGGSGSNYWDTPSTPYRYTFDVFINGSEIISNRLLADESFQVISQTTTALRGGGNDLRITYTGNQEGCFAFLDSFSVRLDRPFIAENSQLKFYYDMPLTPVEFQITGLPSGTNRVWNITDFADITRVIPHQNGSTVTFHQQADTTEARQYIVFSPVVARDIGELQRIENSPNLRNPDRRGKLLIVCPDEFYDAAQGLEDFHGAHPVQPIEAERVKLSEIFREFSSLVPDPAAIRDFIRYAYYNWTTPPEYIWMLGDGSYDYRNIELSNYVNRVPVFEVSATNDIVSRVTDNFFATINNTLGTSNLDPELAIGRLPANSVADVESYLGKLQAYTASFLNTEDQNGWQTTLTFVADDECKGAGGCGEWFHLRQTEDIIRLIPEKFDIQKIYLINFEPEAGGLGRTKPGATKALLDAINRGTLMVNYFGHGDPNTWSHEQVFNKARDLPAINNSGRLPVFVAATCTWGKYDNPNSPSMAEEMIWTPDRGAIATIAGSRATFAFENERFAENVYGNLFQFGDSNKHSLLLGDAVLLAIGGRENDQKYHLLGNPALRLADPEYLVTVDAVSADTLKALSTVSLDATIRDTLGNALNGFNGKALIRVYDALDSLSHEGISFSYTTNSNTLFKGIVTVAGGRISGAEFIVPKSIKYKNSATGRISIYAWSDNNQLDAAGYKGELLFNGTENINDSRGPEIGFRFPDQPDFFDGDYVSSQPLISVEISDDSGINLTGEVGHQIELVIDGKIRRDVTEFFVYEQDSYTSGKLEYTLPALGPGRHELTISVWDNLNNYSEEKITFSTTTTEELTLAQVVNYPNPFEEETHFTFQYQSPNLGGDVSVKIYTVSGRLIREIQGIALPGFNKIFWDGRDRDGDRLANGVYLYKITVDDGERTIEKIEKLAIVR